MTLFADSPNLSESGRQIVAVEYRLPGETYGAQVGVALSPQLTMPITVPVPISGSPISPLVPMEGFSTDWDSFDYQFPWVPGGTVRFSLEEGEWPASDWDY